MSKNFYDEIENHRVLGGEGCLVDKRRRFLCASKFCRYMGIACLVVGIFIALKNNEMTFGALFTLGIGFFVYGYSALLGQGEKYLILHKFIAFLTVFFLMAFMIVEGFIFQAMRTELPEHCRYVIILGAGLLGDAPSLTLRQRLEAGVVVLEKYPEAKVIVSGGIGKESSYTEAEVMKRYLIARGISAVRIIKEENATRTDENLSFGKKAVKEFCGEDIRSIVIATSDYHMFRSKILARKYYDEVYGICAESPFNVRVNYAIREFFALIKMELVDR